MKLGIAASYDCTKGHITRYSGIQGAIYFFYQTSKNAPDSRLEFELLIPNNPRRSLWERFHSRYQNPLSYLGIKKPAQGADYENQCLSSVQDQLSRTDLEALLVVDSSLASLKFPPKLPLFYLTDGPVGALYDFYPETRNIDQQRRQKVRDQEHSFYNRCDLIFLNSQWSADQAMALYGISPKKIRVLPWGPSIVPPDRKTVSQAIVNRGFENIKIFFSGNNWERKGGAIAIEVVEWLRQTGLSVQLTLLGHEAPENLPNFIKKIPFLDIFSTEGSQKYQKLLEESHIFLLPTQADVSPIVISEANSWGVPAWVTDVGGVRSALLDGKNGQLFSPTARIEDIGKSIARVLGNRAAYHALCESTRSHFEERLNWSSMTQNFLQEIESFLEKKS